MTTSDVQRWSLDWLGMDDGSRELPLPQRLKTGVPARVDTTGPRTSPNYSNNIAQAEALQELTKLMGTTEFAPHKEAPPLNHNMSLAMGDTTFLAGLPFGVFGGFNYRREFNFYDEGISRRYIPKGNGEFEIGKNYVDTLALDTVNWAAMVSLALRLHPDHDLAFNYLFNQNGNDYTHPDGHAAE
jgi:hypothetical protein